MVFTFESPTCKEEDNIKRHARGILGEIREIFVIERIAVNLMFV